MGNIINEVRGKLGIVYINRPEARNALTPELIDNVAESVIRFGQDEGINAIAISGKGERAFAAGCDISVLQSMNSGSIAEFMEKGHRCMSVIERCDKPVIAVVNGYALGGGFEMVLACDLVIASNGTQFGFPEVKLGLIPGFGGTQRLPRRVGPYRAKELIMTGSLIEAKTAFEWGLVNRVVRAEKLFVTAQEIAEKVGAGSSFALKAGKRAVNRGIGKPLEYGLEIEKNEFLRCFENSDAAEGLENYINRRRP
jgi:enoyl-CoA hydratase